MAITKISFINAEGKITSQDITLVDKWTYKETIHGEENFVLFRGDYGKGGGKQTNILGLFWWNRYPICFPQIGSSTTPIVVPEMFNEAVLKAVLGKNYQRLQGLLSEVPLTLNFL